MKRSYNGEPQQRPRALTIETLGRQPQQRVAAEVGHGTRIIFAPAAPLQPLPLTPAPLSAHLPMFLSRWPLPTTLWLHLIASLLMLHRDFTTEILSPRGQPEGLGTAKIPPQQ